MIQSTTTCGSIEEEKRVAMMMMIAIVIHIACKNCCQEIIVVVIIVAIAATTTLLLLLQRLWISHNQIANHSFAGEETVSFKPSVWMRVLEVRSIIIIVSTIEMIEMAIIVSSSVKEEMK